MHTYDPISSIDQARSREVERLALVLLGLGVAKGDRIGLWSRPCAESMLIRLASARVGAILVEIEPAYRSDEVRHALQQAGVRILFTAIGFAASDYLAMLGEVRAELSGLACVVTLGDARGSGPDDLLWRELPGFQRLACAADLHAREATLAADDRPRSAVQALAPSARGPKNRRFACRKAVPP
jgi:fatty-acyl-CoA synthase